MSNKQTEKNPAWSFLPKAIIDTPPPQIGEMMMARQQNTQSDTSSHLLLCAICWLLACPNDTHGNVNIDCNRYIHYEMVAKNTSLVAARLC